MKTESIIPLIFVIICFLLIVFLIPKAIDRSEIHECYEWQDQSAKFEGFYLLQWQADQCKAHDITVNAPIK